MNKQFKNALVAVIFGISLAIVITLASMVFAKVITYLINYPSIWIGSIVFIMSVYLSVKTYYIIEQHQNEKKQDLLEEIDEVLKTLQKLSKEKDVKVKTTQNQVNEKV